MMAMAFVAMANANYGNAHAGIGNGYKSRGGNTGNGNDDICNVGVDRPAVW